MWNQKNKIRNRFLQKQMHYNINMLNELTGIEFMDMFNVIKFDVNYKSFQPVNSIIRKDGISILSFGSWRLAKIVKEISSDQSHIQLSALNTLSQLLIDKVELQRCISQFDIVRRLQNILLRRRLQKHKCQKLIPIILQCFVILSGSLQGSLQVSKRHNLINELYELVKNSDYSVISSSACILRNLTQHPQVADYLIHETNWYIKLCDSGYLNKNCISYEDLNLWEYFSHFLKIHPQKAIDRGFFEFLINEIPNRQKNQQILIRCFAFLLNCKEGQKKLEKCDRVHVLYKLLLDEHLESHEFVSQAFQNATAASKIILGRCREFWNLPNVLIQRAHVKNNHLQQLYCLQTLRQISPLVKKYIRSTCLCF